MAARGHLPFLFTTRQTLVFAAEADADSGYVLSGIRNSLPMPDYPLCAGVVIGALMRIEYRACRTYNSRPMQASDGVMPRRHVSRGGIRRNDT